MSPSPSPYPRVKKCLLCIDLKIGVFIYITFEMMVWLALSYLAIDNESAFFHNYDLYKFEEHIDDENNWYYRMIFGLPTSDEEDYDYEYGLESAAEDGDGIDIEYRFQNIAINGILMLIFIAYFLLSFIYMFGITKKNTNFFIPYMIFDFFIIWMSFLMIIGGMFYVNLILIRNCSIFCSVKIYPAICNYSLFKKMKGKFKFTREVPTAISYENRKSLTFPRRREKKENEFELETMNKEENVLMTDIKVIKDRR